MDTVGMTLQMRMRRQAAPRFTRAMRTSRVSTSTSQLRSIKPPLRTIMDMVTATTVITTTSR